MNTDGAKVYGGADDEAAARRARWAKEDAAERDEESRRIGFTHTNLAIGSWLVAIAGILVACSGCGYNNPLIIGAGIVAFAAGMLCAAVRHIIYHLQRINMHARTLSEAARAQATRPE